MQRVRKNVSTNRSPITHIELWVNYSK